MNIGRDFHGVVHKRNQLSKPTRDKTILRFDFTYLMDLRNLYLNLPQLLLVTPKDETFFSIWFFQHRQGNFLHQSLLIPASKPHRFYPSKRHVRYSERLIIKLTISSNTKITANSLWIEYLSSNPKNMACFLLVTHLFIRIITEKSFNTILPMRSKCVYALCVTV